MENQPVQLLIITGQPADAKFLTRCLEDAGYAVAVAADGRQGFEIMQSQKPEVALVDLSMGATGVAQLIQQAADDETLRVVPIILLASPGDLATVERCLALGADDYLVRPFSPTLLKTQVREFHAIRERRLAAQAAQRQRMRETLEHDVEIARDIQLNFLPRQLPQPEGWEIAASFQPAREVAGDFYDAFSMAQGRRVGFVIADVCDKGVGAALFMALIRSLTRAFAEQNYSLNLMDGLDGGRPAGSGRRRGMPSVGTMALENAMVLTNNYITTNHLDLNYFATLFFGMIDPATGALAYINGGHCPPIILGADGQIKNTLKATGMPVGMMPDAKYEIGQAVLEPGDILFGYTDGATDARDPAGRRFGDQALMDLIQQPAASAAELLKRVEIAVRSHIDTADQYDDLTMIVVKHVPTPEETAAG